MIARKTDPLRHDGARYRTAVQPWYWSGLVRHDVAARTSGRIDRGNLDLLSSAGLITLNDFLYSASHGIGSVDEMIDGRARSLSTSLADSGGYQISTGVQQYSEDVMFALLRYCEQFDAAPILDGPTGAVSNPNSILKSVRDCFDFTVRNGRYAISNRMPGKTRLQNVIQGLNFPQALDWFAGVKHLNNRSRFGERAIEDWAFAGATRTYLSLVLSLIVRMMNESLILPGAFIHFLGFGSPELGLALTAIQDGLRAAVDENILVSFDSATPFLLAGRYKRAIGHLVMNTERLSVPYMRMPGHTAFAGSSDPLHISSPIADRLTVGDLCYHASGRASAWDEVSHALVAAHNVWAQNYAVAEANRRLRLPLGQALAVLPARLIRLTEVIREILSSERPMTLIRQHQPLLDSLSHKSRGCQLVENDWSYQPRTP